MDWNNILQGTQEIVGAIITLLLTGVAVLMGVMFIFSGINKMLAHSRGERHGQATVGPVAINLFLGALMVQMSFVVGMISESLFQGAPEPPRNAIAYVPNAEQAPLLFQQMLEVGFLWIYCIGYIAVLRGFVLWNAMANGQGRGDNGWKSFWHIIFGAAAINIVTVLKMITT